MAGRLAAEVEAPLAHPRHDRAVAHRGAFELQTLFAEEAFEAEVGHHRGDHAAAGQPILFRPGRRDQRHDLVAVDELALLVADHQAVGVAVQRDADIGAIFADRLDHRRGVVEPHSSLMLKPLGATPTSMTSAPSS